MFSSCTKSDEMTNNEVKMSADNPQMSQEDVRIMNQIVNFKKKIDFYRANPAIKSGESKSVDSTVWYFEAATNFYQADASFESEDFVVDSTFVEIPKSNGEIAMSDIQLAYNNIQNQLQGQLDAIQDNNKELIVSDVAIKEETNDKVVLKVTNGIGKGTVSVLNFDDWYWGKKLGKCEEPVPDTKDASDIIQLSLNNELPHFGEASYEFYYTDISIVSTGNMFTQEPYTYWEVQIDNEYPWEFIEPCIEGGDIEYFISRAKVFANLQLEGLPQGQEVIRYDVDAWSYKNNPTKYYTMHYLRPQFGLFHLGSPQNED